MSYSKYTPVERYYRKKLRDAENSRKRALKLKKKK